MELPFEREAMKNKPLPEGLDIADSCCYMCLRNLYSLFRNGSIDKEQGKKEKENIIFNWTQDKSKLEFLNRDHQSLRDKIGKASENYKNNPTIENADLLYAAFYNLPDNWREEERKENDN